METGTVKFFDNRDNKRFGFLRLETSEEIFFHFNDGTVPQLAVGLPNLVDDLLEREPHKGDRIVFNRASGRKGNKASPWAFADEYERVKAASTKFDPKLTRGSTSMTYEYLDEQHGLIRCKLEWENGYRGRAFGIPAPSLEVERVNQRHKTSFGFETEEEVAKLPYPLPAEMREEARKRVAAHKEAVARRQPLLLQLLRDILGDPNVEMNHDYEYNCILIFEAEHGIDRYAEYKNSGGKDENTGGRTKIRGLMMAHHWGVSVGDTYALLKARDREMHVSSIMRRYWEMKAPAGMRRWYPGGHSGSGFLGWGENLDEVIAADMQTLTRLGKTPQEVGLKIKEILDAAIEKKKAEKDFQQRVQDVFDVALGNKSQDQDLEEIAVDIGDYLVERDGWMGYQTCPFEGCEYGDKFCPHASCDFKITNKETGEYVMGGGLVWHLISEHGFFEGKETIYRVDPEQLVKVLYGS